MLGKTISYYKVLEKLGEGGMGVVYKAEDTKLKREVALKFLPTHALQGQEEKDRFTREAQAAAALNHPNIAHIYAIDEADGQMFLAMEFIEGQELVDTIHESPLPIDRAIDYATQIAAGLQAAHEKGIVHRDIKSANIMVTDKSLPRGTEGVIKIMDFGLAKLANRSKMTQLGTTLGTAAYMSPEQARGEVVDHRADIWSLGVVLYEMISGQLPFKGDYEQAVIYSILNEVPEPLTALRSGVPIALDGVISKALAKDANTRYQNVEELPADLKAIDLKAHAGHRTSTTKGTPSVAPSQTRPRLLPTAIAGFMTFVALIALWSPWRAPKLAERSVMHFSITEHEPNPAGLNRGGIGATSIISPDGTRLVYHAKVDINNKTQLYVRPLEQKMGVPLAGTEGARNSFFSPDGQWIAFFASNELKKVSMTGGIATTLAETNDGRGGTWGPDDSIVFTKDPRTGLSRIPASGGIPQTVTFLDTTRNERSHRWPQVLPGGKAMLFTIGYLDQDFRTANIAVHSSEHRHHRIVVENATYARYLPTGHLAYLQGSTLFVVPFDVEQLQIVGSATPVLENIASNWANGSAQYSFSQSGALIYRVSRVRARETLVLVNRQGNSSVLIDTPRRYFRPRISSDGRFLVVESEESGKADIWAYHLDSSTLTRVTFGGHHLTPLLTPDDQRIVYSSIKLGQKGLWRKPIDGSGPEEQLVSGGSGSPPHAVSWSPDGRILAYQQYGFRGDIWMLRVEDERKTEAFLKTSSNERSPHFSPDANWIAYVSDASGRDEVYIQQFAGIGKRQISTEGGSGPVWARNGRELFYRNDRKMMVVEIRTQPVLSIGQPRLLFEGDYLHANISNYDVTPDGQGFVMVKPFGKQESRTELHVVLNWFEEIKRLAQDRN